MTQNKTKVGSRSREYKEPKLDENGEIDLSQITAIVKQTNSELDEAIMYLQSLVVI